MLDLEGAAQYVKLTGDQRFKGWFLQTDSMAGKSDLVHDFGGKDFTISLIDQFAGQKPVLINRSTVSGTTRIWFVPTILLDSNIVSYLHQYVQNLVSLTDSQRTTIYNFLAYVTIKQIDYNPFFYYIESLSKSNDTFLSKYSTSVSIAILKLHSMKAHMFLESGIIEIDEQVLSAYQAMFGGTTIEEIAVNRLANTTRQNDEDPFDMVANMTYATLLKMATIHKSTKKNPRNKLLMLHEFMEDNFRIHLARELQIALYYFAGEINGFIPLQKGCNYINLIRKMKATAWDILLLRQPELLLESGTPSESILAYIATADANTCKVGRRFTISSIQTIPPDYTVRSNIGFDFSGLTHLSQKEIDRIQQEEQDWLVKRVRSYVLEGRLPNPPSYDEVTKIIEGLEEEVKQFCS